LLGASLAGVALVLLLPVDIDPLRDDAVIFHRRVSVEGGTAELLIGRGLVHGSLRAMDRSPGVDALIRRAADFLHRLAAWDDNSLANLAELTLGFR
jgi:acetyl esterase